MNTETFYLAAVKIAEKHGFEARHVTTMSYNFGGKVKHGVKVYAGTKHIDSQLLPSTGEALKSFKSAIAYMAEEFSDKVEHIDLS